MPERVTFGLFEFDPESGALTRDGRAVRLQPQPARVLAILVDRAGELVSREDLRQQVWSDGTFVDFERGLNFCIAQIRGALGESADNPTYIETLPRRGYRFIAPVRHPARLRQGFGEAGARLVQGFGEAATAPAADPSAAPRARRGWAPALVLVGLALVTAALVAGAWRAGGIDRRIRIAVVPFDNETGLDDFDSIARAVADATVARLASPDRTGRLAVIGNAASLHQPRAFRDLKRIGGELAADYIVLAQMKRDETRVRLIAHLIRVKDEAHVWANTYDRAAFTLEVQSEIAEAIAAAVADRLAGRSSQTTRSD